MQTTGLNRDTIDKFYTKTRVVDKCIQSVKQFIDINYANDVVIEPSAGNGVFIPQLQQLSQNCLFYDIQPEHNSIIQQDYLTLNRSDLTAPNRDTKYHIIGNPPFGRQSSFAIKFIKHSANFCDTIAFILPKSFKKDSMQKHFPLNFHLLCQIDLESNSFIINDSEEKDIPCVFQIWQKKDYNRDPMVKLDPIGFSFVNRDDNPDIAFRRVGVNAGKIDSIDLDNKNIQSHYFIKFDDNINKTEVICKINTIIYPDNNTVGPKSISKQQIIQEFNKLI
jgi:hypothetical protein